MKYALVVSKVSKKFDDAEQAFSFRNLLKRDQFHAVSDVSFKIKRGEIFGVLGPNGCGKSTLIRMISTLLVPDKGLIKVFGKKIGKQDSKIRKIINRVSVDAAFFKKLSCWENLIYAARLYGLGRKEAKEKTEDILKQLDFPLKKLNSGMDTLSRGQQQKVAIARAFLSSPMLILLDEPTTGLDPKSKIDVQEFIKKNMKERKKVGILLTTHDMVEAENLCDRISIMDEGKIIAEDKGERLKKLVREKGIYEIRTNKNVFKVFNYLKKSKKVDKVVKGKKRVRFYIRNINNLLEPLSKFLKKNDLKLVSLRSVNPSLEDVFISLTGKSLKDE